MFLHIIEYKISISLYVCTGLGVDLLITVHPPCMYVCMYVLLIYLAINHYKVNRSNRPDIE